MVAKIPFFNHTLFNHRKWFQLIDLLGFEHFEMVGRMLESRGRIVAEFEDAKRIGKRDRAMTATKKVRKTFFGFLTNSIIKNCVLKGEKKVIIFHV